MNKRNRVVEQLPDGEDASRRETNHVETTVPRSGSAYFWQTLIDDALNPSDTNAGKRTVPMEDE